MKIRLVERLEDLNALRPAWEGLNSSQISPMQQFIWTQACAQTLMQENELRIVVLEDGGQPVAIAPLVQNQWKPYREIIGMAEFCEPTDFIYSRPDVLLPLAAALSDIGVPLRLRRIPGDSPLPKALEKAFRGKGVLVRRPDNSWPWISLHAGWVEPESQFNSKRRSHLLRHRRIASEIGTVTSEVLSPEPKTLVPLLNEAFAVEAASWKGQTGTALALDQKRGAFFRRYAMAASDQGILRLCFLRIGGRIAAMQLGIELSDQFWLFKVGYDNQFARCSPGNLLMRETLRYAATRGLKSLHFLGLVEPWTKQWTKEERPCVFLRAYPLGFRSATVFANDIVKSVWHKLSHTASTDE